MRLGHGVALLVTALLLCPGAHGHPTLEVPHASEFPAELQHFEDALDALRRAAEAQDESAARGAWAQAHQSWQQLQHPLEDLLANQDGIFLDLTMNNILGLMEEEALAWSNLDDLVTVTLPLLRQEAKEAVDAWSHNGTTLRILEDGLPTVGRGTLTIVATNVAQGLIGAYEISLQVDPSQLELVEVRFHIGTGSTELDARTGTVRLSAFEPSSVHGGTAPLDELPLATIVVQAKAGEGDLVLAEMHGHDLVDGQGQTIPYLTVDRQLLVSGDTAAPLPPAVVIGLSVAVGLTIIFILRWLVRRQHAKDE